MKRSILLALTVVMVSGSGCISTRNDRPGFFTRLYNRIHGNDVGAPCASGLCGAPGPVMTAPAVVAPTMIAPSMVSSGCGTCGTELGYPMYGMQDGFSASNYVPGMMSSPSYELTPGYETPVYADPSGGIPATSVPSGGSVVYPSGQ